MLHYIHYRYYGHHLDGILFSSQKREAYLGMPFFRQKENSIGKGL